MGYISALTYYLLGLLITHQERTYCHADDRRSVCVEDANRRAELEVPAAHRAVRGSSHQHPDVVLDAHTSHSYIHTSLYSARNHENESEATGLNHRVPATNWKKADRCVPTA